MKGNAMQPNSATPTESSPVVSTLGTFHFDGRVWAVESHPQGEIWVSTDADPKAKMYLGPGAQLSHPVPVGEAAPLDWLTDLKQWVISVLAQAGDDGRGPWAYRETHLL